MIQVTIPYGRPANISLAKSLAKQLAVATEGAAFDPQEDRLLWPTGESKRYVPVSGQRETSMLTLEWFIAPSHWAAAVSRIVPLLGRRIPEALPVRYGEYEPPQYKLAVEGPDHFANFALNSDMLGFWFARRPSFGGYAMSPTPRAAHQVHESSADRPYRVGHITANFDEGLLHDDSRWHDALAGLLVTGAEEFGAFFAAAQVDPGWTVGQNNRPGYAPFVHQKNPDRAQYFLRGRYWQGLPPVPGWLSWYGDPYRELVRDTLRNLQGFEERRTGVFLRLAREPQVRSQLPAISLPPALTYTERPPVVDRDSVSYEPAVPTDRAATIPDLEASVWPIN
jgi:hypothetical protein